MRHSILLFTAASVAALACSAHAQDKVTHFTSADGTQVTLTSGQPSAGNYGPAPEFATLDTNHDGRISRDEADAYPPLINNFDYIAPHAQSISKARYQRWVTTGE